LLALVAQRPWADRWNLRSSKLRLDGGRHLSGLNTVYATALADRGQEFITGKVGVEPSGDAFNSISLDPQTGAPLNPMINAGAIATAGLVAGDTTAAQWRRIAASLAAFIGRDAELDEAVYRSESETGYRNRAIAWMLKNFGIIDGDPMAVVENYFRQCSLLVNCRDLACMAATLANGGVNPVTGRRALPPEHVEHVLSVMTTCGMALRRQLAMRSGCRRRAGSAASSPSCRVASIASPPLERRKTAFAASPPAGSCHAISAARLHRTGSPAMVLGRTYTGAVALSRASTAIRPPDGHAI
jgi:glutaminase